MPQAPASVAEVLRGLAAAFKPLRCRWYVFGAQALVLHGLPRATADIDVTVIAGKVRTARIAKSLSKHGFDLRGADDAFVTATRVLPVFHRRAQMPVDVVLGSDGLEPFFAAGAVEVKLGRQRVPVASPTHLAVMKLVAGRPKDLEDVVALMSTGAVDDAEVERLCREIVAALGEDDALRNLETVLRRSPASRRS